MDRIYRLFEAYGIELEYMIVDLKTLAPLPISDLALRDRAGAIVSDVEDGRIAWSNELASHVIELKTSEPARSLRGLAKEFHRSLLKIDSRLAAAGAGLLPTAMHPFMDPKVDAKLWSHEASEIYELYDRIFDCSGHGWTNLQSMHINLPFFDDDEFGKLHAAVRFLIPILPAIAASSPLVEGQLRGPVSCRLVEYQRNQRRVPSIAGQVIPERAWTEAEYDEKILAPMYADIAPFDPRNLLPHDWLNSRGAIARFARGSIEIRVLDLQESPSSDIAIAKFIVGALKGLVTESLVSQPLIRSFDEFELKKIFDDAVAAGTSGQIRDARYLAAWGASSSVSTFGELIEFLLDDETVRSDASFEEHEEFRIRSIAEVGNLSERIKGSLSSTFGSADLLSVYSQLRKCLIEDSFFRPC